MVAQSQHPEPVSSSADPEQLTWVVHPARMRPQATAMALVICLLLCVSTGLMAGEVFWGFFAAAFLMLVLNRFFFPSGFTIDARGISARHPLRKQFYPWSGVKRVIHDPRGAYLSRRPSSSRADGFTGMHVLFDHTNQDQVLAAIDRYRKAATAASNVHGVIAT